MKRKTFLKQIALSSAGFFIAKDMFAFRNEKLYGHNGMMYSMDTSWSKADQQKYPVNDCHEMIQDAKGRIFLLTNETKNNVLIYATSGKLLSSWGSEFPGAHGLSLADENGSQFLFITDTNKNQVYKTTLNGKILLTIDAPLEAGIYKEKKQFIPTEVTIDAETGDFFVADGYGAQYILHYDSKGTLKGFFGGRGEGDKHLDNAHGICIDQRDGQKTLLVTDRTRNCFKRFSMTGELLNIIPIPGACVCRPVIRNNHLYAAVLRSPEISKSGTGFVTILDKNNKVVSNIGGTEPVYENGTLKPLAQAEKLFVHPHDVCVDRDENIYVAQWASGKVYPYKFIRRK